MVHCRAVPHRADINSALQVGIIQPPDLGKLRAPLTLVKATRHRPRLFPPGDPRRVEAFEGEFARRVLDVLAEAGRPLGARDIALWVASGAGESSPGADDLLILTRKVRRTFSRNRGGAVREGAPGAYLWRLAAAAG